MFRRRNKWRNALAILGLVGLGYFVGRPDQLQRLAQGLNNNTARTQYLTPIAKGTAPNVVYTDLGAGKPETVNLSPGKYGWNDFYHQEGRFSIVVPPLSVKETSSENGKNFSIETENEFYFFGYKVKSEVGFISQNQKQVILAEAGTTASKSFSDFAPVAQRTFALNGNPGMETHLQHRSKPIKMIMRQMFVDDRLYTMGVGSPHHNYTQVFMNSFRVH